MKEKIQLNNKFSCHTYELIVHKYVILTSFILAYTPNIDHFYYYYSEKDSF